MTVEVFRRQFTALFVKNWIVLSKHPYLNLLRCFILPVAYGIFLAVAQLFLVKPSNFGIGTPVPVRSLADTFDPGLKLTLFWADETSSSSTNTTNNTTTTGTTSTPPTPSSIIAHLTRTFTPAQLARVRQVSTRSDVVQACPQNFNLFSECFAAVVFESGLGGALGAPVLPGSVVGNGTTTGNGNGTVTGNGSENGAGNGNGTEALNVTALPVGVPPGAATVGVNYTILVDGGLFHVDVVRHTSDYEERVLPLQWAIDSAIIELQTGSQVPTPLEWPFTQESNTEQFTDIRLSYIRGLRELLVLALFICYIGIAYQLPGSFMGERANLLTSHLQAMGLGNLARITSWHLSITLAYFPAWVIVALVWHFRIFTMTHIVIVLVVHILLGLSLCSWSFFISAPFGNSPQLAAVASTFLAIVLAILALVFGKASTGAAFIFTIIFPPGFYVFAVRAIAGFEVHKIHTDLIKGDPDNGLVLLALVLAAAINTFLWPYLAVLLERRLYDAREPKEERARRGWFSCFRRWKSNSLQSDPVNAPPNEDIAISIRNLRKTYSSPWWKWRNETVVAIEDLSFDIPKFGIFVLLGSNGAGKSTALSIMAGLQGRSAGEVLYAGGVSKPGHGVMGIVPQKNVLFSELTCYQTLKLWQAVKRPARSESAGSHPVGVREGETGEEDVEQLLRDCDLGAKVHANAATLSGGQKRKLQLAIGLVGGSRIVLVDECTSGVDPLSRRALWRTLTSVREERTIVFTTHFLDEADLLGDHIAILAAPGKLVAEGSPVQLKSSLGDGYRLQVALQPLMSEEKHRIGPSPEILSRIQEEVPQASLLSSTAETAVYQLKSRDSETVGRVLNILEKEKDELGVASYEVHGTTMEDIFLSLMQAHGQGLPASEVPSSVISDAEQVEKDSVKSSLTTPVPKILRLTNGRKRSPLSQAFTIFHKRVLIGRRAWLTPALSVLVAVAGTCIPLFFLSDLQNTKCTQRVDPALSVNTTLFFTDSPLQLGALFNVSDGGSILESPPGVLSSTLGASLTGVNTTDVQDNATFIQDVNSQFRNLTFGGISVDLSTGNALVAWEATPPGATGPVMLNLVSNVLYNHALNASGQLTTPGVPSLIAPTLQTFPGLAAGTLVALKWNAFFGAAMAVFPAFFALYVSNERRSSVQAMQLSNGLADPIGLWLGHLMFDGIFATISATLIIIIFAGVAHQLHGLGFFWVVLVLYGLAATLFAYCVTLFTASPLASFAAVAGYQIVMFVLYEAGYLLTETYAKTSAAGQIITIIHFTLSILSPVASPLRASFVSVNLFSLLCDKSTLSTSSLGTIIKFGGPITYLIVYIIVLFVFLVWFDSGSKLPRFIPMRKHTTTDSAQAGGAAKDVLEEEQEVSGSSDPLRVLHVAKKYKGSAIKAVDDVSFGVGHDTILALLGPNGAGKTTTFNIIRGDIVPDQGDVLIQGTSVIRTPRVARLSLGVCPQFTAIDSQLTVREHLMTYGRLKGLYRGPELNENVEILMEATALSMYADRLASKLSGGNQRKLSLAIALIGNPSVILIDEFSTGVDAKMKRDMWITLKNVAIGKAVVITTHSMEEASTLANKVGIIASKMLAVGSTEALAARYPIYEVHFSCRTREESIKAQELMTHVAGSRKADDVATRYEVPVNEEGQTLADLFRTLSEHGDSFSDYTVERVSLESIFLKVIREHNIKEEDFATRTSGKKGFFSRLC